MKLISDNMTKELETLSGMLFTGNSIVDNMSYSLKTKFIMPRTSDIVHLHIAHILPLLSDEIVDYADSRGVKFYRPQVPSSKKEYDDIRYIFSDLQQYMVDTEKLICAVIDLAEEEKDRPTKIFLDKFLINFTKYTKMSMELYDFVEKNGTTPKDCMFMDFSINHYMGIPSENSPFKDDD